MHGNWQSQVNPYLLWTFMNKLISFFIIFIHGTGFHVNVFKIVTKKSLHELRDWLLCDELQTGYGILLDFILLSPEVSPEVTWLMILSHSAHLWSQKTTWRDNHFIYMTFPLCGLIHSYNLCGLWLHLFCFHTVCTGTKVWARCLAVAVMHDCFNQPAMTTHKVCRSAKSHMQF